MATWGSCNFDELKKLRDNLQKSDIDKFCEESAKELAARLLAKAIKRTPVGDYDQPVSFTTKDGETVSFTPETGKVGGTLRRGWTYGKEGDAQSLVVEKQGSDFVIYIMNPVEYASYVEFGHRTKDHKGWVKGQFMMTISEKEVEAMAPAILERRLNKMLEKVFV